MASTSMSRYAQKALDSDLPPPTSLSQETLDALFPLSLDYRGDPFPSLYPGVSAESARTLVKLLKDNHEQFHIFFNERGFHNHTSHHLYAIYALGGGPSLLESAYDVNAEYQRKAHDPPKEITDKNWTEHLDDRAYWRGYTTLFTNYILKEGIGATLEKFVFAREANHVKNKFDEHKPKMLDRFLSGLLHPMIHAGHGVEFNAPGMVAEGLAMACITERQSGALVPRELFFPVKESSLSHLTAALSLSSKDVHALESPHVFSILGRMAKDPTLAFASGYDLEEELDVKAFDDAIEKHSELIWKYASEWIVDAKDPKVVNSKIEELAWLVTLIYAVGGLQIGKGFRADFFLMHNVTSCLFIPSYTAYLTPSSLEILLRTYLGVALAMWISRGRPSLSIVNFYASTSTTIIPPGPLPSNTHKETLNKVNMTPNPWFPVIQSTMMHPNEHYIKIQRTFAHFAAKYGMRPAGYFKDQEDLEGTELLDGTLFLRAAGLTINELGWIREGEEKGDWAVLGFNA